MKLLIGLGNPGEKYKNTRHNLGFKIIEAWHEKNAPQLSAFKLNKKWQAEIAEGKINGEKIILIKPLTFMNESGRTVGALAKFYNMNLKDILVIYDDIDLPQGTMRLRKSGSAGGHKGVQSLINHLGGNNFMRLRVGISPKVKPVDTAQFVLKKIGVKEKWQLKKLLPEILESIDAVVMRGKGRETRDKE